MADCIVVGGGLIGMLSARELKKLGMEVLLLEKGELGKEASWAGGGILSPLHPWRYSEKVNELANIGHKIYPKLAEELRQESGIDPEYIRSGLLVLGSEEQQLATDWADHWSMNLSTIESATELQQVCPGLSSSYTSGLYLPDIAQMRNPRLVKSARGSLDALGIKYKEHTKVTSLLVENGKARGVVVNGEELHADNVLIAGGAWSAELLKPYQNTPDISPVKGQMVLFKGAKNKLNRILLAENRYLIPRKDGRIVCGSTIEHTGFEKQISQQVKVELSASAKEIFPELAGMGVEHHWAGLRPGSPNGDPYIGQQKEVEGLYMNAGHYRNGVILGVASAQRVAKLIAKN